MEKMLELWQSTGLSNFSGGQAVMTVVGFLLIYLAIRKGFEPLLLLPIGFGAILSNIPLAGIAQEGGILYYLYGGIKTGVFPLLVFMGVGAMTDFGPMLANPKTMFLGAAAQFGIFSTLLGALALNVVPGFEFNLKDAAAIAIIGGADGPTAIYVASKLAPELLGAIAVAAYSYMALVPLIQPPIVRLLTTEKERNIEMQQLRAVGNREKILFPLVLLMLCAFLLPSAAPLVGMFCLGNLMTACGVVERLSKTSQNELINIVTIFLGLAVGSKLSADVFLTVETLGILMLGMVAFCIGTAAGVLMAKLMNLFIKTPINPHNFLLMHAMGPNVAGVIGSAVAAGILISLVGG